MPDEPRPTAAEQPPDELGIPALSFPEPPFFSFSRFLAERWFEDALEEAQRPGRDARRREILFAACFAETYLFEWVRDEVLQPQIGLGLKHYHQSLMKYFPTESKRGARQKWKDIPKQLLEDGYILGCPDLGRTWWEDFRDLLNYRDGLVHAAASRPAVSSVPATDPEAAPCPTLSDMEDMKPGWPLRVVVAVVREFNSAAQTTAPSYLDQLAV